MAVEQLPMMLAGFVVGGTVVHGHEGFPTVVLHERVIIAIFQWFQKAASLAGLRQGSLHGVVIDRKVGVRYARKH